MVPPEMLSEALLSESKGSPPKKPWLLEPSLPPAALKPSSRALTVRLPPETVMVWPSSPS